MNLTIPDIVMAYFRRALLFISFKIHHHQRPLWSPVEIKLFIAWLFIDNHTPSNGKETREVLVTGTGFLFGLIVFNIPPHEVARYYVIPSEKLLVCPSAASIDVK